MVDPARQIMEMLAAVCPGGRLVLTVPNGRTDRQAAMGKREDGTAYWGHIHFWSPESWPLYIADVVDGHASFSTDVLDSGQNIAIIRKNHELR